ncbi:uncharacterized protein LOC113392349 [Vanessa tameamea]|uniref:Uncharacterized protein LOC113392349 n=1 Tax=Vanessa tameamea TaxID=334116 RepID=A0A8B8HI53_VANTA|nr:uncharacterized protein LOC113392349 [Vanessa tameamea]XP_046972783.1 uncharacterized protein LOC124539430 [Vanessa cardui]XP_047539887.1 uncharacterized protein LOC125073200 [Vanessa atalanta]
MTGVRAGRVPKRRRGHRVKTRSVLRMMAIMQDRNSEDVPREFLETGRTGRRNAMPDILHPQGAEMTTADLPSRLQQLVTTDPESPQPGTSKTELDPNKVDEKTGKKDSCS